MASKAKMVEPIITTLSMETHLSTILSMDSSLSTYDETVRDLNRSVNNPRPPDINLPLSALRSSTPPLWNDACEILNVGLGPQLREAEILNVRLGPHPYEAETHVNVTKVGKKCAKRLDSVWGALIFFSFYFKPALNERSKCKIVRDSNGVSGYDKKDLNLDVFLVQHDMENMYMWAFKERPENALGKMQLRSFMNGHSRQGERPFPFSVDKGFVRSHRMQRKHYRGLSNPQCVHGIEVVRTPNFAGLNEEERKKWMELTGRDLNFSIPPEASDYSSWRTLPNAEHDIERAALSKNNTNVQPKRLLGSALNLSVQVPNHVNGEGMDLLAISSKRRKSFFPEDNNYRDCLTDSSETHHIERHWVNEFTGVMSNICGPVTGAKSIYEDDKGFLIIVSLPCADLQLVKVTWRNTLEHGIVKISCVSTGGTPTIQRNDRTYRLTDKTPELCPPGEFIREISLPARIPEDAKLEAFGDEAGTMLEINVPKHHAGSEEHEVRVCLRPSPWSERAYVDFTEAMA